MKRFYILPFSIIALIALAAASFQTLMEARERRALLNDQATSLFAGIEDSIVTHYELHQLPRLTRLLERVKSSQGLLAAGLCIGKRPYVTVPPNFPWEAACTKNEKVYSLPLGKDWPHASIHSKTLDAFTTESPSAELKLVIALKSTSPLEAWVNPFLKIFLIAWGVGSLALFFITSYLRSRLRSSLSAYRRYVQQNLRALIAGKTPTVSLDKNISNETGLAPIREIERLSKRIFSVQPPNSTAASSETPWLKSLKVSLRGRTTVVFANREPYIHQTKAGRIEVLRPASGLVTALEPILRQTGGLWIGHGSGNADRQTASDQGEIAVPPGKPSYRLKRIWLTPEEEQGYYYGFSNEGLWPLCHLAHNRPAFRVNDWQHYNIVNQRFCDEAPESIFKSQSLILVQDYHFALLPRMLKNRAVSIGASSSRAPKIGLFWHIPWPNPEAFGICPWNKELLWGMLGSDVIGFHTQYHCNNFLETCDRYLEARIDRERFSVTMEDHETLIRAFPIGIDTSEVKKLNAAEISGLKAKYGIQAEFVAVGVDRLDYTKGLVERVDSVERFLEKYPEYVGRFSLVQMGSPSRATIPAYQALTRSLEEAVKRVNGRFGNDQGYQPVILLSTHHEWDEIQLFYQLGDVCMVTSLHDGMNLVAKEYVWCQKPERGSLVLSKFTGASRELTDAFIVNPYSTEEMADALAQALRLRPDAKAIRMLRMRHKVETHNAFHWARDLIQALIGDNAAQVGPLARAPQSNRETIRTSA